MEDNKRTLALVIKRQISALGDFLRPFHHFIIGELFPLCCMSCKDPVTHHGGFCQKCWAMLRLITAPQCICCGFPFPFQKIALSSFLDGESETPSPGEYCGACLQSSPAYDQARSVYAYDDPIRAVILSLKHGDGTQLGSILGKLLVPLAKTFLDVDVVVPVPLHWSRRFKRQYNQAGLLAQPVADALRCQVDGSLLKRIRKTQSQGTMSWKQRAKNVKGAFVVPASKFPLVNKKHILLIDDVHTTGVTIDECAKVLKTSGASRVSVLTVARALRA